MASEDDFVLLFDESGEFWRWGASRLQKFLVRLSCPVLIPTVICRIEYVGISTPFVRQIQVGVRHSAHSTNLSAKEAKAVILRDILSMV